MKIPLNKGFEAQIDEADLPLLIKHHWHVSNVRPNGVRYAVTNIKKKKVYMHRLLMDFPTIEVDHINGDGLDNRRVNLRAANKSQQARNSSAKRRLTGTTSKYKGVSWWSNPKISSGGYWKAALWTGEKTIVKYCRSEIEAAQMYNKMAREHFGAFARTNWIEEV